MANQIQMRHDTLANWQSSNPVLLLGEMGYVTDSKYLVFGDGATAFTGLTPWYSFNPSLVGVFLLTSGSPYTIPALTGDARFAIKATTNPYIINLPQAINSGYEVEIIDASQLSTGLVKIVPHSGDAIGQLAANVPCYLQNLDQSGMSSIFQSLKLQDAGSGFWAVVGGQFAGSQAIDPVGSQYELGKLHHLPLGNTTSRQVLTGTGPAGSAWSTAVQVAGSYGVPAGAKAVRCRVIVQASASSSILSFSDNNSNVPAWGTTAHPTVYSTGSSISGSEMDIPLNASGQFYAYQQSNQATAIYVAVVGYYMGD